MHTATGATRLQLCVIYSMAILAQENEHWIPVFFNNNNKKSAITSPGSGQSSFVITASKMIIG